ncbi:MAG TPA: VIT domain-containing protein [Candidatus Eisenbacteria bacterium]
MAQRFFTSRSAPARGAALVTVDGRNYPLRSAGIVARAEGGLALTTLTQEFDNPFDESLEVLYTLPLPADGAVLGYSIWTGERVIRGEVERRESAKAVFEKALLEGRVGALLEQDRDDTFSQRLGSLPPGQPVRVEIEVLHRLDFVPAAPEEPARWEYRFPTVVGVRYQGEPERVPDSGRLDVDRVGEGEIPTRVELDLTIADGLPTALAVVSPTHDIRCTLEAGVCRARFRSGARLDRDLMVRWAAVVDRVGARLVDGPGRPGDDGRYALLTLTPPPIPDRALKRDLTVLLDASGSMSGPTLEWAKRVVGEVLRSLEAGDRFEVLAFASETHRLTRGLVEASPAGLRGALECVAAVEAGGATEMTDALVKALTPLRGDSQRQVVLVTDGYIGFESQVVGEILRRLPRNARVHAVGVGAAPNRALTWAVARAGRGVEVFALDEPSAAAAGRRLCRATARPVLTEIAIRGDGVRGFAPEHPRDVLAGQPLVVALELEPRGGSVDVSGRQAGAADAWVWRIALPARSAAGAERAAAAVGAVSLSSLPLGALYGREVIADLELRKAGASREDIENQHIDARIEAAGLRHRLASRMTSLVAVAEVPSVDPNLPRRRERLPVELPADVSAEGTGLLMGDQSLALFASAPLRGIRRVAMGGISYKLAELQRGILAHKVRPRTRAAGVPPRDVVISGARALRIEANEVCIEFESPCGGFLLPDEEVNYWLDGKTWLVAQFAPEKSSPRGPHAAGLVVRLALRIEKHPEWVRAHWVEVRWVFHPAGAVAARQVNVGFTVQPETPGPRA